jgi:hypothetical protein
MTQGLPVTQLLRVGVPLAEIDIKENVKPYRTGIVADTRAQEVVGVKIAGAQESVLKADAEELWMAFGC